MSDMKMSDVFGGEVVQDGDTLLADGYGELADFSGYKKEARYVTYAINNHDRLTEELQAKTDMLALVVEENTQQRESLDAFRELVKAQTKTMNELNEKCKEIEGEKSALRFAIHKASQGYRNLIELRSLPNSGWYGEAQDLIDLCDDTLE